MRQIKFRVWEKTWGKGTMIYSDNQTNKAFVVSADGIPFRPGRDGFNDQIVDGEIM